MKALQLLVAELKKEVSLKTIYKIKSESEARMNKKFIEDGEVLRKRFDHLVIKHNECKATIKLQNNELEHFGALEGNIEALKKRIFQYEKDMKNSPDFKGYFKQVDASCVK